MSNMQESPAEGLDPKVRTSRRRGAGARYPLQATGAATVAAALVCLPLLVSRDDPPHEWAGIVLIINTLLASVLVLVAAGLLLALGRIRPMAASFGKGTAGGVLVGLVIWAVLLIA